MRGDPRDPPADQVVVRTAQPLRIVFGLLGTAPLAAAWLGRGPRGRQAAKDATTAARLRRPGRQRGRWGGCRRRCRRRAARQDHAGHTRWLRLAAVVLAEQVQRAARRPWRTRMPMRTWDELGVDQVPLGAAENGRREVLRR